MVLKVVNRPLPSAVGTVKQWYLTTVIMNHFPPCEYWVLMIICLCVYQSMYVYMCVHLVYICSLPPNVCMVFDK